MDVKAFAVAASLLQSMSLVLLLVIGKELVEWLQNSGTAREISLDIYLNVIEDSFGDDPSGTFSDSNRSYAWQTEPEPVTVS